MSRYTIGDAIHDYAAERFGITEPTVMFEMEERSDYGESGRVDSWGFAINISGTDKDGSSFFTWFEDGDAVQFLDDASCYGMKP